MGYEIIRIALEAPLRQIAQNSGVEPTGIVTYIKSKGAHAGYDFTKYDGSDWQSGTVEDMMKTDPNFKASVDELGKKLKLRIS